MQMTRRDMARVLSPLALFAAHVIYLAAWSPDPFFNKWIDGSFSFFLALVLCNIIRARIVAAAGEGEAHEGEHPHYPGDDGTPDR